MQLLAVTVEGLSHLQEIWLSVLTKKWMWQRGFFQLFFTLPRSIKTCELIGNEPHRPVVFRRRGNFYVEPDQEDDSDQEDDDESELDPKDKEWIELATKRFETSHGKLGHEDDQGDVQEVRRRTEPLSLLDKFVPWEMKDVSNDDILAVFDHYPTIEHLEVPCVSQVRNELEALARSTKERCPRIRTLSSRGDLNCRHLFSLMEMLPHQQLQEVKITNLFDTFDYVVTRRAFKCHSTALRKVDIHQTLILGNKGILAILELCGSLEVLIKYHAQTMATTSSPYQMPSRFLGPARRFVTSRSL